MWKTTNVGSKWTEIVNLGFPYYWFGVKALNAKNVVISGFNDSTGAGLGALTIDGEDVERPYFGRSLADPGDSLF